MNDDELLFRCISAPGLEEDDLYAAMESDGAERGFWGDRPLRAARLGDGHERVEQTERQRRHEEMLAKWDPVSPGSARKKDSSARRQTG